jgi:hypothetical protein
MMDASGLIKVPAPDGLVHVAASNNPEYATHREALCGKSVGAQLFDFQQPSVSCSDCFRVVFSWLFGEKVMREPSEGLPYSGRV